MRAASQIPWPQAIRHYAFLLIALVSLLSLLITGYVFWEKNQSESSIRFINDFHLTSAFHSASIREEIASLLAHIHYGEEAHAHVVESTEAFNISSSLYLIRSKINQLLDLQRRFADPKFTLLTQRLKQRAAIFEKEAAEFDADETLMNDHIQSLIVTLTQLERLHTISYREHLSRHDAITARHGYILIAIVLMVLMVGALLMRKGMQAIDAIIDRQREVEKDLQLSQFSVDHARDSCFGMNQNGQFFYVNDAAIQSLGYSHKELVNMAVPEIDLDISMDIWKQYWKELKKSGSMQLETRFIKKDGMIFPVEISANYIDFGGKEYVFAFARDITERKYAEEALQQSEQQFSGILELAPEAIVSINKDGIIRLFNRGAETVFGYNSSDMLGKSINILLPERFRSAHRKHIGDFISSSHTSTLMSRRGEIVGLKKDGTEFPAEASITKLKSGGETIMTVMLHDVSQRKKTDEHLNRTQKMEALGNLTGGVAHEFNNLLMAILGNLELIDEEITGNDSVRKKLSMAMEGALRGKSLTQQLLTYSRSGSFHPELISDLNGAILRSCHIFELALGNAIKIKTKTAENLSGVMIDPAELEGVLLNLVINARDAMSQGGTITILTANKRMTKEDVARSPDLKPGDYVTISVRDNGCGIPPDVAEHVFDPFFTTKEVGKGTGLGLSMVLGFVQQSGGTVELESKVGHGTTVTLCFPKARGTVKFKEKTAQKIKQAPTGSETILYVEDDPVVLMIGVTMLESLGYTVLQAKDGPGGLALLENGQHIDLLLTDVVMPGAMLGTDLARKALAMHAHLKIILATGYNPEEVNKTIDDKMTLPIIAKPFRKLDLASKVRQVLNAKS